MKRMIEELAYRSGDGIVVSLLWSREDDHLTVAVFDSHTDEGFELSAEPTNALDVFYHPYAYAAFHGIGLSAPEADWCADAGPLAA